MYYADPNRGRRRRALLQDKLGSLLNNVGEGLDIVIRDFRGRMTGLIAQTKHSFTHEDVSDQVLQERVRARLGRCVSHPRALSVKAQNGRVTLEGPVLADEVHELVACIRKVHGVQEIENCLEVHEIADNHPALQGGTLRRGERTGRMQGNWSPAFRLISGLAGGALLSGAVKRGGSLGLLGSAAGGALLARAVTNLETKRLFGIGAGRRAIELHKSIVINAPLSTVFEFWARFENFPKFMSHLKEVRPHGDRSQWIAYGPAGSTFEWHAVVTAFERNNLLAWRSEPGGSVQTAGIVRFEATPEGATRIDIKLSYNPPAGALGHAVASLFGADPKTAMDEDVMRLKSLLEEGKTTAKGKGVAIDITMPGSVQDARPI